MVVLARLVWVQRGAEESATVRVTFTSAGNREKVKIVVSRDSAALAQPPWLPALLQIIAETSNRACD